MFIISSIIEITLVFLIYSTSSAISRPSDEEYVNNTSGLKLDDVTKMSYHGAQVLKVYSEHVRDIISELLDKGEAEKWGENTTHTDMFITKEKVTDIKSFLNKKNVQYKIIIENVQEAIDTENPPISEEEEEFEGRKGHKMTWRSYHRLDIIYGYLDYLAATYPDFVTVGIVGHSVEGRPIKFIKISSGKPNAKKFWFDGGIHAREWISPATVTYIISELIENRNAHMSHIDGVDFYSVPVVNPDGYEFTHVRQRLWRKNRSRGNNYFCSGTDLNRNWAFKWGGEGTSGDQCRDIYRGPRAFSEPETKAVSDFILNNKHNMEAFVTFHSYGQYFLIPFGYDPHGKLPHDYNELLQVARQATDAMRRTPGASYTAGNSAKLLYAASGGADDWAKGAAGIKYAYTIELRDQGSYGFVLPANFIIPTGKEALSAIKSIAKTIRTNN